ncbi:xylulose kinase [Kribbella sandramycini]|uniref:Xylulose kinase n=1 Tax=Kribbella sandramycini TaxID=60450 RepID=A0A7Y4P420_9ACTN|nr:FGGY family carbohydrate kinase [Kribbella sandramycini]MBB6566953.1 xylulokinase [Kribbella sandramycini]NOL44675.1 xylulose kinase [Kribbella sandramycini]
MTEPRLVAGVDCSTQATKVVVCDAETGAVLREGRAPHPDGTQVDPGEWWKAWETASDGLLDGVEAISIGGQQHGMVLLDEAGDVVHPAVLWNDTSSADATAELIDELGGPEAWAEAVGSVPVASFTVTKLRWIREAEAAKRAAAVVLPHDWMTHRLAADRSGIEGITTDRGDASGTGWWSPATNSYREDLVVRAFGRPLALPRVAGPAEIVGRTASGAALAAGTGDNAAAALGLDLQVGDVAVSLGTSGTAFARSSHATADTTGFVAGFADATGEYLPLVCTLNAARVMSATAQLLGMSLAEFDEAALASSGSQGLVLLPFLDGERTPDLPHSTGLVYGLTRATANPDTMARAAVEGLLCGLADAVDALRAQSIPVNRIHLLGGGAKSRAVQALAPGLLGADVVLPDPAEYVALGAARQAAWALTGALPTWSVPTAKPEPAITFDAATVRANYAQVLTNTRPLLSTSYNGN